MTNRTRTTKGLVTDGYFELVKRFPLRPIRSEFERKSAVALIREQARRGEENLSSGELDYMSVLARLIVDFEREHLPPAKKSSPLEILKFLMEQNDMRSGDLGQVIGSAAAASLILRGRREMSKAHIRKIAERFSVSPALFF